MVSAEGIESTKLHPPGAQLLIGTLFIWTQVETANIGAHERYTEQTEFDHTQN